MSLVIKQNGLLALLQDAGRVGQYQVGLTNGGPIDPLAFKWANKLCGNAIEATAIEVTFGQITIEATNTHLIAVTGAPNKLTINNQEKSLWQSHTVKAGDVISIKAKQSPAIRNYIAINGGFDVPLSFGSTATVIREKVGGLSRNGLSGSTLQIGDTLKSNMQSQYIKGKEKQLVLPCSSQPKYSDCVTLRTVPSYQECHFSSIAQRVFYSSEYRISDHYDRMGYRLNGHAIKCNVSGILSEGICQGAIQIPDDGQPIVLLNDRQTIGGYPKIGAVISSDLGKLGQLGQGGKVRFEPISIEQAHNIYHLEKHKFEQTALTEI